MCIEQRDSTQIQNLGCNAYPQIPKKLLPVLNLPLLHLPSHSQLLPIMIMGHQKLSQLTYSRSYIVHLGGGLG